MRVVERAQQGEIENRYRLLFPGIEFEAGGVEGFVRDLRS